MLLSNVYHKDYQKAVHVRVDGRYICAVDIDQPAGNDQAIRFDNALIFPGLINSHDHLDFDLFPNLGNRIYANYREWGVYIHRHYKKQIEDILVIPKPLRTQWGVYKNLICGVTTVINHGAPLAVEKELINIIQSYQNLHSVGNEKRWKFKLNHPLKTRLPCVIHIGEGTDNVAAHEIEDLLKWNLSRKKIIGVHGVAMNPVQAKKFSALIWCPLSNYYLFDTTADIKALKDNTRVLFGTDSTLTADWNIWNHLKAARRLNMMSEDQLYDSLTSIATKTWNLAAGEIARGRIADLVVAKYKYPNNFYNSFYDINPEDILLVLRDGKIRLFDESLSAQLGDQQIEMSDYSRVSVGGAIKYLEGDVAQLINSIRQYNPKIEFPITPIYHHYHDKTF